MTLSDAANAESRYDGAHTISALYCKLFSDSVTARVCMLRKQELNGKGGFSCTGCAMERC
jgi:hypothetical protein